jgi:phospholipid/cholesterol/gamma-HCH transport system substrate-binding protein
MATSSSSIRVGLVIAGAIAIAAMTIFSIGKETRFLTGAEVVEAHFGHINGLQAGAPVSLSGVNIGAVESIRFPADPQADYVVVKMWIEGSAAGRVRVDSLAQIKSIGLLGDKFIELTRGTPSAEPAEPGTVLRSEEPIDYEQLLRRTGTGDFVANVVSATNSLRVVLEELEKGNGLLAELLRPGRHDKRLDVSSIAETLAHIDHLTTELDGTLDRLNHGQGLAAAMLNDRTNGHRVLAYIASSAASLRSTAQRLDQFTARLESAHGTLPRLLEDRQYADDLLPKLKRSTRDLDEILRKINSGQGTLGQMVNDPSLYYEARGMLDGGGWGWSLLHGFYGVTHPFRSPSAGATPEPETRIPAVHQATAYPAGDLDAQLEPTPGAASTSLSSDPPVTH